MAIVFVSATPERNSNAHSKRQLPRLIGGHERRIGRDRLMVNSGVESGRQKPLKISSLRFFRTSELLYSRTASEQRKGRVGGHNLWPRPALSDELKRATGLEPEQVCYLIRAPIEQLGDCKPEQSVLGDPRPARLRPLFPALQLPGSRLQGVDLVWV